ncbi:MAG: hypothetical protein A3H71_02315 [Candidatus Sungbacteria bacterium RIFCSPLOWO2_02_FULL_48_13b]|uniref:Large ribosomal subunit protein uL15 n=2 Tax=Candidatus Sungiibacteriota TaxID=1817917 RepID=A0A1G2LGA0_9BACT|nr:MAG: hypothetical protein A3C12_03200 [Candidatus Sungbacteria bacterium RIFCSPHIGHO2_02_FULL_49_20]OHA09849.1 MAG: hypothetical protein A3H71_02315 [Candidatus Sungbacteria bacterium RIFCSPLOWO2_02_FULL_48_13b]
MQLHTLSRNHPYRKSRQIGRGGKRGTTAGRGTKGQKARAGHKIRPQIRDFIKRLPKLRGFKFHSIQANTQALTLASLEKHFSNGETVEREALIKKGLVFRRHGALPPIKIVGNQIGKKLSIIGIEASRPARAAIEKVGGSVR